MKRILVGMCLSAMVSTGAQAAIVFGVNGTTLISFDSAAPGQALSTTAITGITGSFAGIDFRPANGVLYGLSNTSRTLYTINTSTGVATAVGGPLAIQGSAVGFDFNPTIDRIRVVADNGQNYVVNPNTGTIQLVATPINGITGATVSGNAYTSSTFGAPAESTQLYSLDYTNDLLATQNNNGGTLTPVGSFGQNLTAELGFDISGSDAFVSEAQTRNFYSINLATGRLTTIGRTITGFNGIAIAPVPEPATWAMMIAGFGMTGSAMRRRTAQSPRVRSAGVRYT